MKIQRNMRKDPEGAASERLPSGGQTTLYGTRVERLKQRISFWHRKIGSVNGTKEVAMSSICGYNVRSNP